MNPDDLATVKAFLEDSMSQMSSAQLHALVTEPWSSLHEERARRAYDDELEAKAIARAEEFDPDQDLPEFWD